MRRGTSLDQNPQPLLGEEWPSPPHVVDNESAEAGCHSDVSSEGQLVSQPGYLQSVLNYAELRPQSGPTLVFIHSSFLIPSFKIQHKIINLYDIKKNLFRDRETHSSSHNSKY